MLMVLDVLLVLFHIYLLITGLAHTFTLNLMLCKACASSDSVVLDKCTDIIRKGRTHPQCSATLVSPFVHYHLC